MLLPAFSAPLYRAFLHVFRDYNNFYRKTAGHIFTKKLQTEKRTQKEWIIATVKNIDAPILTCVWQELEYRIDEFRVTRGAYIEHLEL